jgi:hypothetical protein
MDRAARDDLVPYSFNIGFLLQHSVKERPSKRQDSRVGRRPIIRLKI